MDIQCNDGLWDTVGPWDTDRETASLFVDSLAYFFYIKYYIYSIFCKIFVGIECVEGEGGFWQSTFLTKFGQVWNCCLFVHCNPAVFTSFDISTYSLCHVNDISHSNWKDWMRIVASRIDLMAAWQHINDDKVHQDKWGILVSLHVTSLLITISLSPKKPKVSKTTQIPNAEAVPSREPQETDDSLSSSSDDDECGGCDKLSHCLKVLNCVTFDTSFHAVSYVFYNTIYSSKKILAEL